MLEHTPTNHGGSDQTISMLKEHVGWYPDFPSPGILFQDFFPLIQDKEMLGRVIELFAKRYEGESIDIICGLESRGFILGAALAFRMKLGFVPVRKPNKLPGETYTADFEKEYGKDSFELAKNSLKPKQRVLILDDLIATGGSAQAAIALIRQAGAIPVEFASVLAVPALNGAEKLGIPTFNLL